MFVRHLSYFVALAREQHFARAADSCHITQPTLSAAIRKLETDLEVPLVVRGHRFLGLTSEGERVLAWARQILNDYDGLRLDLAGAGAGLRGTLRLGVIPAAMPLISFLTARFSSCHPVATVEVNSMTSRAIQRALDTFELDAGITYLDNEPLVHVRSIPLYKERYVFVTGKDCRHAGRCSISWREAAQERLCLLSEDMQNRRIIDGVFESLGLRIRPAIVSNSFLAICSHLRQGGFASIVPNSFFYVFVESPGLIAIELTEPGHSQVIGLVLGDREPLPPMAVAISAAARDAVLAKGIAAAAGDRF
jgi:DNA-binding transcriptional LysR family regulator